MPGRCQAIMEWRLSRRIQRSTFTATWVKSLTLCSKCPCGNPASVVSMRSASLRMIRLASRSEELCFSPCPSWSCIMRNVRVRQWWYSPSSHAIGLIESLVSQHRHPWSVPARLEKRDKRPPKIFHVGVAHLSEFEKRLSLRVCQSQA